MLPRQPANQVVLYLVFCIAFITIGLQIERHQSGILFLSYFSAFFCYLWLVYFPSKYHFHLGVLVRLVLFLGLPTLSDDVYRFIWDGHLLTAGLNPFAELPSHYLNTQSIPDLNTDLYEKLNSPEYFTIYPPLNQFIFWLSVKAGGDHWLVSTNIIRAILFAADIGSFIFLRKILIAYNRNTDHSFIYFLNPLVILEGVGNLHFEVLVVFFLLLGIYYYKTQKRVFSNLGFGLAIATKLLPLIYLPALLFQKNFKTAIVNIGVIGAIAAVTFVPMLSETFISGIGQSLGLYFQKFEFNASIYFLLREVGFSFKGYNVISSLGPALSICTLLGIMGISYFGHRKQYDLVKLMFLSLFVYLSLSTIVHPWYIIPLIAFGVILECKTAIVWSFFIFLTYLGYTKEGFELSMLWVVLEYTVVFVFFVYEFFIRKE